MLCDLSTQMLPWTISHIVLTMFTHSIYLSNELGNFCLAFRSYLHVCRECENLERQSATDPTTRIFLRRKCLSVCLPGRLRSVRKKCPPARGGR